MSTEFTNLLPLQQRRAFRRGYFIRLATVAVYLFIAILLVQCVLLLPAYIYESQAVDNRTAQLSEIAATMSTSQEKEAQTRLSAIKSESGYLLSSNKSAKASTALRAVLALPRPGITLSAFTFGSTNTTTAANANAPKTMVITGTANTREDLRSYDSALGALPFVSNADLPISAYAKESAIPFTITLTGTLTP